jgi:cell division protein FtsW
MISSASVVMGLNNTGNPNYYFFSQLKSVGIGLILFYIAYKVDYRIWRRLALPMMIISLLSLILVLIPHVGINENGASRWINLGFFDFQPSEFVKLSLIVYLAAWFENKGKDVRNFWSSTFPFIMMMVIIGGLVMKQPDMGTATILALVAGVMYFVAGAKGWHILAMIGAAIGAVWYLIASAPYRMARFMIFLNPGADSSGKGYHINQALLAIGSGGIMGLGFGKSRQKFNFLPEPATDSIFAITSEELGMLGGIYLLILFLLFAIRGLRIALDGPDVFSRLLAVGITTWIAGQAIINIMAIASLMPLTGVPLPFISYGGSSVIMLLIACGILLNISKHIQKGEKVANNRFGRGNWWSYIPGFSSN